MIKHIFNSVIILSAKNATKHETNINR